MSILSTSTKVRAAGKAVTVPAKVARRLPESRGSRRRIRRIESLAITAARAAESANRHQRRQRHPARTAAGVAAAAGGTALAVYLLDRDQGRKRRHELRDRGAKALRQAGRRGASEARHAGGVAKGRIAAVTPTPHKPELNDPALARKVESEIFRGADAPKGSVDVSVEAGVVHLRGQLDDETQIARLVEAARAVEGVRDVESLLHTPGQPAEPKPETLDSAALDDTEAARRRSES
jgi:osmotically-inducible protein OsmY